MKEEYKVIVKLYRYKGNEYAILKGLHDGIIRAINYKYVDSEGRLMKPLNGLEMLCDHNANTVKGIIKRINNKIDIDEYLLKNGIDRNDNEALIRAVSVFYNLKPTK